MRFNIRRLAHGANMLRHGVRIAAGGVTRKISGLLSQRSGGGDSAPSIRPKTPRTPRTSKPTPSPTQVRRGSEQTAIGKVVKKYQKKQTKRRGMP